MMAKIIVGVILLGCWLYCFIKVDRTLSEAREGLRGQDNDDK